MTVGELRDLLGGVPDDATVQVSLVFTAPPPDEGSGDALGAVAVESDWDGPSDDPAFATSFSLIGQIEFDDVVQTTARWVSEEKWEKTMAYWRSLP
jgi:hypothetical protein